MLKIIFFAIIMIVITTSIHATSMITALRLLRHERLRNARVFRVSGIVVLMFFASLIESAIWALPYALYDVIDTFEEAIYFSMVTYTTLGYGDIVVQQEHWRLLASFEAANGIIMFGWTTAIVMTAIRFIYFNDTSSIRNEE